LKVGKDDIKRSGEWQTLSSEEKRYVNKNIKILERSGLKLKPEARAQFK
jgi:Zn-dependent oligopeptidase